MRKEKHRLCQGIVGALAISGIALGFLVVPKVSQSFESSHPSATLAFFLLLAGLFLVVANFFVILVHVWELLHHVNHVPFIHADVDKTFRLLARDLTSLALGFALCLPAINTVAATVDVSGIRALGVLFVIIPILSRLLMMHLTVMVRP